MSERLSTDVKRLRGVYFHVRDNDLCWTLRNLDVISPVYESLWIIMPLHLSVKFSESKLPPLHFNFHRVGPSWIIALSLILVESNEGPVP